MFCRVLARGSRLLCLWTSAQGAAAAGGSTGSRKRMPAERIVLQVGGGASSICSSSISICSGFNIACSHGALIVAIVREFIVGVVLLDFVGAFLSLSAFCLDHCGCYSTTTALLSFL